MATRSKRSIFVIFMLGVLAFSLYKLVVVDRMGFCYKRLWFVSTEELILKTIDGLMQSGRMKLDKQDTSAQAYLKHHPDCCGAYWGTEGPFNRGLLFFGSATVVVSYEMSREHMNEDDKKRYQTLFYDYYSDMTACGESLGYSGSTETKSIDQRPEERSILLKLGS